MSARGWVRHRIGTFSLDVSWDVEAGSVTVLYGPSGAGKSLTLRAIAGLIRPDEGRIELDGAVVFDHATGLWIPPHHRRVGLMPQEYGLFPHLTVAANIAYGAHDPDSQARATEIARTLDLQELQNRRIWELSGGQRQRVALARALATQPRVLLLDEPFAALDSELRRAVRQEIRQVLTASHVPVILVTHDAEEALALADHVQIIDNGRIVAQGDPVTTLRQPAAPRIARLAGVENLLRMRVASLQPEDGAMICETLDDSPLTLETPLAEAHEGDVVTVGIRSSDVILASSEPQGLSARNVFAGTVTSIEPRSPGHDVTVDCGGGLSLVSHVTRHAITQLGIREGVQLWAVVKASSCFLLSGE